MPFDSLGNYSLPAVYLATTGEDATAAQHNTPLEDLAAGMNGLLLRSGVAAMTGAFKGYVGTEAAPGIAFNGSTSLGFYKTSNGWGWSYNGAKVIEFGAGGIVQGATPIGSGMDYWGTTAPAGWLFPYGQAVSRTTYAALFAALGTTYGSGDGSTTFNLPDKRGRASFGKDDMGGTSANRITNQSGGWNGDTLGAAGGAETHALTSAQNGQHSHGVNDAGHAHLFSEDAATYVRTTRAGGSSEYQSTSGSQTLSTAQQTAETTSGITIQNSGSGAAHNNLPPGIVCNYIIFAGA